MLWTVRAENTQEEILALFNYQVQSQTRGAQSVPKLYIQQLQLVHEVLDHSGNTVSSDTVVHGEEGYNAHHDWPLEKLTADCSLS